MTSKGRGPAGVEGAKPLGERDGCPSCVHPHMKEVLLRDWKDGYGEPVQITTEMLVFGIISCSDFLAGYGYCEIHQEEMLSKMHEHMVGPNERFLINEGKSEISS